MGFDLQFCQKSHRAVPSHHHEREPYRSYWVPPMGIVLEPMRRGPKNSLRRYILVVGEEDPDTVRTI
jgi:hypothetical protein